MVPWTGFARTASPQMRWPVPAVFPSELPWDSRDILLPFCFVFSLPWTEKLGTRCALQPGHIKPNVPRAHCELCPTKTGDCLGVWGHSNTLQGGSETMCPRKGKMGNKVTVRESQQIHKWMWKSTIDITVEISSSGSKLWRITCSLKENCLKSKLWQV